MTSERVLHCPPRRIQPLSAIFSAVRVWGRSEWISPPIQSSGEMLRILFPCMSFSQNRCALLGDMQYRACRITKPPGKETVMDRVLVRLIAATSFLALLLFPALSEPKHGIAMQGEPALPPDYQHFDYVNPDAPKGGSINYCVVGSFDNLNPFILKSLRTTARGMIDTVYGNLVFEPLMQRNYDEPFSLYGLLADSADMDPDRKSIEF